MYSFRCNSCSKSFESRFGLNNHKRRWNCSDRSDANAFVNNQNDGSTYVASDSMANNTDRTTKNIEIIMQIMHLQ